MTIIPCLVRIAVFATLAAVLIGCSGAVTPSDASLGGASAAPGGATSVSIASGGSATGGFATGGAAQGGTAQGGLSSSGAVQGGMAQGGLASGGAAAGGIAAAGSPSSSTKTVNYTTDSSTIFANPERGFYHHEETHANSHVALSAQQLTSYRTSEAITLILRLYYLESFRNSDISATYLDAIATDLGAVRLAGLKAILRFAYTDSMTAPYGDANRARVVGHIAQLAPILQKNADVILTVQAGFIGAWGEWYYTDYFGDQGQVSSAQWDDRRAVVDAWLAALPTSRTVELRTPAFKQHFFGAAALTANEAFTTASKARVGHHNDCFLSSSDDQGTYVNVTGDKTYLAAENLYLPQGGETCAVSTYSDWTHAASDMAQLHYTYLNRDYNTTVLGNWGSNIDAARRLLGYRLSLVNGTYASVAAPGGALTVSFSLRNDGYAPPAGQRSFDVLLRHETTNGLYRARLPADPRRLVPGTGHVIDGKLCVPTSMAAGTYRLLLALADPAPTLRAQAAYAIRLANTTLWDASTGYHDLQHSVRIAGEVLNAGCPTDGDALVPE